MQHNEGYPVRYIYYLIAGIIGVLLVFVIILNSIVMPAYTQYGQRVQVPDITNRSLEEATTVLENYGFEVILAERQYDAEIPSNFVVDQSPKGGSYVKPNRKILLSINISERPPVVVPDLRNLSLRNAQLQLRNYGLQVGDIEYITSFEVRTVIDQSIQPGSKVDRGTRIHLKVSNGLGEGYVLLPDLVGIPFERAQLMLNQRRLRLGVVVYEESSDYPINYVMSMFPSGIDSLMTGSSIDLVISRDPNLYQVDDKSTTPPDTTRN